MYLNLKINKKIKITQLSDLENLRIQMEVFNLKPNFSELARVLKKDRRTIKRHYYQGKTKQTRNKPSKIDEYTDLLDKLLGEESIQIFKSKRILWQYLVDQTELNISYSAFRAYLLKNSKYNDYFKNKSHKNSKAILRVETMPGEQAQIDWKEDVKYTTKYGEKLSLNVFCMVLSYSRYKIFHVTLSRNQDVLISCITECLEHIEGVPKVIVCDNMKTTMDKARTVKTSGVINIKFQEYAKEMGFELKPCVAYRPQTKGKVENIVKLLDEIYAYNGKLDYTELVELVNKIMIRWNLQVHQTTREIPIISLQKEKDSLLPLPHEKIRNRYKITTLQVKVNKQAMISYKSNQYSVPIEYIGKKLNLQVEDNYLYLYDNMKLVVSHLISEKKLNYKEAHYEQFIKHTWNDIDEKRLKEQTKRNLAVIGERFNDNK